MSKHFDSWLPEDFHKALKNDDNWVDVILMVALCFFIFFGWQQIQTNLSGPKVEEVN